MIQENLAKFFEDLFYFNLYEVDRTRRGGVGYIRMVWGNAGWLKEAAARCSKPVTYCNGAWRNGGAGSTKRYYFSFAEPTKALYQEFSSHYKDVCKEAAAKRKAEKVQATSII